MSSRRPFLMMGSLLLPFAAPGVAAAQYYSTRPNPAHPDAYDREVARVRPGGAALVIGTAAADAALQPSAPRPKQPVRARQGLTKGDLRALDAMTRRDRGMAPLPWVRGG